MGHLAGCTSDARRMAALLSYHHSGLRNFESQFFTDEMGSVSTEEFRQVIREFVTKDLDTALIYFGGHAQQTRWGTFLVTDRNDDGFPLTELMDCVNQASIPRITLVLDCCFSGAVGNVNYSTEELSILKKGVSIFSSSSPFEHSIQGNARGIYTDSILSALHGGAADILGRITISGVQSYISQFSFGWTQSPFFKCHADSDIVLRISQPKVLHSDLRKIDAIFKRGSMILLNPSYEPTAMPHAPEKEAVFRLLQKYRDASLVVPVGAESLYDAAMKSRRCELTALGKYYRELVRKRAI